MARRANPRWALVGDGQRAPASSYSPAVKIATPALPSESVTTQAAASWDTLVT